MNSAACHDPGPYSAASLHYSNPPMNATRQLPLLNTLNDARRTELWASLALRHCRGVGTRTACSLLRQFGSAYAALQALQTDAGKALFPKAAEALCRADWRIPARQEWDAALPLHGVRLILWTDNDYPALLKELPDAPVLLYARGDLSLLRAPAVAVVGTRRSSERGRRDAAALAGNLAAAGLAIVSGMARGIDRAAHKAAMPLPGGTIAVLGTGIDVIYPASNTDLYNELCARGLLLSEYAPGTRPEAFNFPIRNRIISGLSLGVLVIEATLRSGSLITARYALEQNRTVYAVGGNVGEPGSKGCQELIRQGAVPVFSHLDILRDLQALLVTGHTPEPAGGPLRGAPAPVRPEPSSPGKAGSQPEAGRSLPPKAAGCPAGRGALLSPAARPTTPAQPTPGPRPRKPNKSARPQPAPQPAGDEQTPGRILTDLVRHGPLSVDALCERLDLTPAVVSAELVLLEVRGHIRLGPDGRYEAV